ncbi:nucleoporin-like protein [Xylogone sp. PMI_703]|nr:nucleoporin-like protein [Xylogone sp. PMI_703]
MAPVSEISYFPPLDKCLNGDLLVISWKAVFHAIKGIDALGPENPNTVDGFLCDPETLDILAQPFNAFPKPSSQSKSAFERKTSAINVTPSSKAKFDIKEIKDDAQWLSKEADISEISALRVVIEECQSRPYAKLRGRFSEEELISIQEAAGDNKASHVLPLSLLSSGLDVQTIKADFDSLDSRRARIVATYFSERRYILKCLETLLQRHLYRTAPQNERESRMGLDVFWIENIGERLWKKLSISDEFLLNCVKHIRSCVESITAGSGIYKGEGGREDLEMDWTGTQLAEATHAIEIVFQVVDTSTDIQSSAVVLEWFQLVSQFGFFNDFAMPDPSIQILLLPLQSVVSMVSLTILSVGACRSYFTQSGGVLELENGNPAYIMNPGTLTTLQRIFMDAAAENFATAGPSVFGWGIILQAMRVVLTSRKLLPGSEEMDVSHRLSLDSSYDVEPTPYDAVLEDIMDSTEEDPIQYLVNSAVNSSHVLENLSTLSAHLGGSANAYFSSTIGARMRITILDLISSAVSDVGYISELITATLSAMTGGHTFWDLANVSQLSTINEPINAFLSDSSLMNDLLKASSLRYPYESLPYLKMVRAIAACTTPLVPGQNIPAIEMLRKLPTFTYLLTEDFMHYETANEDENNNTVRLTESVQLFEPRSRSKLLLTQGDLSQSLVRVSDTDFCIRQGTLGRIIYESGPKVALWFHEYSGLKYFGKLLETYLTAAEYFDATVGGPADSEAVAEIIGIFATTLLSITNSLEPGTESKDKAIQILEEASAGLHRNGDIITVVFSIFEEEIQRQSANIGSEALDILISCVQFIYALIPICPSRVWPLLSRSGLLDGSRDGDRISNIVDKVELVSGRYDLLLSCTFLYDSLVEDFVTRAVLRKCGSKSGARFGPDEDVGTGVPDQVISKVLLSFTRYMVDTIESSCTWKFETDIDRLYLNRNIMSTFDNILHCAYGVDIDSKSASKLLSCITPAAKYIAEGFLLKSSGLMRFQPLLRAYLDGFHTADTTNFTQLLNLWTTQVNTTLAFTRTLLRVAILLDIPASQFEGQLFKASPLLARLYASNEAYHLPIVTLFEALIVSASGSPSEPPSLLGHMGAQTSASFLTVLSDLDKPLARKDTVIAIWHLLSIVVSSRQQWFANYLLTGKTPKDALQSASSKEQVVLSRPLLNTALDALSAIDKISKPEALAMLEFVALAQNFWPWAMYGQDKHTDFITGISEFVGHLKPIQPSTALPGGIDACYQTRIAAYIAEILAMHLFHLRQRGDVSLIKGLLPNLSYYSRFAVSPPSYNSSLHGNLKRNFEAKFVGCSLDDFKRTTLEDRKLGRDFFYDIDLASKMLQSDAAWAGKKNDGFSSELEHANVNLSLVDTQIALLHGWKFLILELSSNISKEPELQKIVVKVIIDCLTSNRRSQLSEGIFTKLKQTRADLALILMQRLIEPNILVSEMDDVLFNVWETIRSSSLTFELALGSEDVFYYRSLLKMLFLALRVHVMKKSPSDGNNKVGNSSQLPPMSPVIQTVLEVLERVVAQGIRHLATAIHDQLAGSSPEDIALLTGILQTCLRIPHIEFFYSQIVTTMASCDAARVATTLFSWSDNLAIDGDPIYGELSILFLLELSSMPPMAEQLAIDGVLGHISSANITNYMRRGSVSPFADSVGPQRCYSIWVRGILPLLLNLLDAVQGSIASEVSLFLNQFPSLITNSAKAFDAPEISRTASKTQPKYITLSMCAEVHSLALISYILNIFRERQAGVVDIPEVKWDSASVLENVDFWLGTRAMLRDRILPMGGRDVELTRQNTGESGLYGAKNRLEERVVSELMGIRSILNGGDA